MATRTVTRQSPHIETLSVNVQVIRIGNRQMTQSVFRQLQREPLIDSNTCTLRGVPWGWVEYFWDGCGMTLRDHLHVVWQKGEQLRRSCIDYDFRWPRHLVDELEDIGEYICTEALRQQIPLRQTNQYLNSTWGIENRRISVSASFGDDLHRALSNRNFHPELCEKLLARYKPTALQDLFDAYEQRTITVKTLELLYAQQIKELRALEQLFIAV